MQRIKIVEISDLAHTVAWDLIESIPHVSVLAATHTVKLKRVTEVRPLPLSQRAWAVCMSAC